MCEALISTAGSAYDLVARGRLDVKWHRFPRDALSLEVPGVVWVPFRATEQKTQYINDCFAIGPPREMRPYLLAYDALLSPASWRALRRFEATADQLDTEELWEVGLLDAGVLARQHRSICFNVLSKDLDAVRRGEGVEAEDNCRSEPARSHPHGYSLDGSWLETRFVFMPAQFEHDALLAARLLHLWFAEWTRLGRPAKVMDLGCGRATMIEQWLRFLPASFVGLDLMPGLRQVLGDDALELDLAAPLPRRLGRPRECRVFMAGGDEALELAMRDQVRVDRLLSCCANPGCGGVDTELMMPVASGTGWMPGPEDMQLRPRNVSGPGSVGSVPWAGGRADWVLLLDVCDRVPRERQAQLFESVARLAAEGVVTDCRPPGGGGAPGGAPPPGLERFGFSRDLETEDWLRPFPARARRQADLRVYRRRGRGGALPVAEPCGVELVSQLSAEPRRCEYGQTWGCVDPEHIWVAYGCCGWFSRGGSRVACLSETGPGAARSSWAIGPKAWQYVECRLAEPPGEASRPAAAAAAAEGPRLSVSVCGGSARSLGDGAPGGEIEMQQIGASVYQTERLGTFQHPMLAVRLSRAAKVEILADGSEESWAPAQRVSAGVCYSWNAWPATGRAISLRIRPLDGDGPAAEHRPLRGVAVASFLWAEWFARRGIGNWQGSLAQVYDMMDPFHEWGNRSRVWAEVAWGSSPGDGKEFLLY